MTPVPPSPEVAGAGVKTLRARQRQVRIHFASLIICAFMAGVSVYAVTFALATDEIDSPAVFASLFAASAVLNALTVWLNLMWLYPRANFAHQMWSEVFEWTAAIERMRADEREEPPAP